MRAIYGLLMRTITIAATTTMAAPGIANAQGEMRHVPRDYPTIQSAVDSASAGDTIMVDAGVYRENVVVSRSTVRLVGAGANVILDGDSLIGIGISIKGASAAAPVTGVEVSNFEVRNFERGIIAQFAANALVTHNYVHDNADKMAPAVLGDGAGIELVTTSSSDVSHNIVVRNGLGGIQLRVGSTNNAIHHNDVNENGWQSPTLDGVGILDTGLGTNDNRVEYNVIDRNNGRGVLLSRPSGTVPITGNLVAHNQAHGNQRAGIAVMAAATANIIVFNDARDNNLSGLPPCYQCNLVDLSDTGGNTWDKNLGTFNGTDACMPATIQ
jgi:Right handed beta helix region